jgi:hypothetical protein
MICYTFLSLLTRSKNEGETELQQATPVEQIEQLECHVHM